MHGAKSLHARWLAGGVIAGAAITIGLVAAFGGFSSPGRPHREAPVLAVGVAPVKGGTVVAYLHDPPANLKVGQGWRPAEIGTAPIDDSGHFEIRVDPELGPVARDLRRNGGFVNVELEERGADGNGAITVFPRTWDHSRWSGDPSLRVNPKSQFLIPRR